MELPFGVQVKFVINSQPSINPGTLSDDMEIMTCEWIGVLFNFLFFLGFFCELIKFNSPIKRLFGIAFLLCCNQINRLNKVDSAYFFSLFIVELSGRSIERFQSGSTMKIKKNSALNV